MSIRINNKEYAWGDVAVTICGRPLVGVTGIEYKLKQAKEARFGSGRHAKSIQSGKLEIEGTLTIMQSELIALNAAARAKKYDNLLGVSFDIIVSYAAGVAVTIDKVTGAEFTEIPAGMKEGDMQAEIALPFIALAVDYDITAA